MSPATRSTASTRPRTPTRSSSTPAGAVSRPTSSPRWPTSSARSQPSWSPGDSRRGGLAVPWGRGPARAGARARRPPDDHHDGKRRRGCGVAVSGDSGTGKSTLLAAALASAPSTRVLGGACDPLSTPRPLGPFRDVAPDLDLGRMHIDDGAPLARLCEEIFDALRTEPTVLVVEDLHWVDAASAEVLRFLARRLDGVPVALLISYRPQETGTGHAARPLLGDFARLDGLATVELGPLSV